MPTLAVGIQTKATLCVWTAHCLLKPLLIRQGFVGRVLLLLLLLPTTIHAQQALYNSGNIRIHANGQLGFHTHLINDTPFENNLGLAGFYGDAPLTVSGAMMPVFYDTELLNPGGLDLLTPLGVTNNHNFIIGDVRTPRNSPDAFKNFIEEAFYVGDSDATKVDGYAAISNKQSFTFPVGDSQQLRPLILNSSGVNAFAKCAYFLEDPNNPSTFPPFSTDNRAQTIAAVSNREFWRLEGSLSSTISLSWNTRSDLGSIAPDLNSITLMGWSKIIGRWVSLGQEALGGDLDNGFISSAPFLPDDYEIITFGSLAEPSDILTLDNYLLTPNGDGINDFLEIIELEQSPNNKLSIFDRNGLLVFEMTNYRNEFTGISNVDNLVINREQGLPEGIYFYVLSMDDLGLNYQGFLYLER